MGIVLVAFARRIMLRAETTTKPAYHAVASQPSATLALPRQNVNPHSHSPATIRMIQFIFFRCCPSRGLQSIRRLLPRTCKDTPKGRFPKTGFEGDAKKRLIRNCPMSLSNILVALRLNRVFEILPKTTYQILFQAGSILREPCFFSSKLRIVLATFIRWSAIRSVSEERERNWTPASGVQRPLLIRTI